MTQTLKIGIIGDFNSKKASHQLTNTALPHAADSLELPVSIEWIPTPTLEKNTAETLQSFHALWCSPGSPYLSMDGALAAIQIARTHHIPFFGT